MEVITREVFAVIGNTDNTEGRGKRVIKSYCETLSTAKRLGKKGYIQGSDCPIEKHTLYSWCGTPWLGPVAVEPPTVHDLKAQVILDELQGAIDKAKRAGLTDRQIKLISEVH